MRRGRGEDIEFVVHCNGSIELLLRESLHSNVVEQVVAPNRAGVSVLSVSLDYLPDLGGDILLAGSSLLGAGLGNTSGACRLGHETNSIIHVDLVDLLVKSKTRSSLGQSDHAEEHTGSAREIIGIEVGTVSPHLHVGLTDSVSQSLRNSRLVTLGIRDVLAEPVSREWVKLDGGMSSVLMHEEDMLGQLAIGIGIGYVT